MLKKREENKELTVGDLDEVLDKALESQSKTILEAVDFGFKNIRKEMGSMGDELQKEMGSMGDELQKEIGSMGSELKGEIKDLKKDTGKILNQQDRFVKRLDDLEQESRVSTKLYKNHDREIEGHKKRILALEIKS